MRNLDLLKRVKVPSDVPDGPHFAVIIYGTRRIHFEGDERSRTNPGHGYPAHTDTLDDIEHWVTTERAHLEEFITELDSRTGSNKKPYVIMEVARKGVVVRNTKVTF